jgi:hypothetical protein
MRGSARSVGDSAEGDQVRRSKAALATLALKRVRRGHVRAGGHPVVLAGLVIVALACHAVCVVAAGKAAATVLSEAGELR